MPGPRLKKRFGQHHLTRAEVCQPLLDFLRPGGRRVLEIGPGGGILTRQLLRHGAEVSAIEMDPEWAFTLRRAESRGSLRILIGDAMALRLSGLEPGTLVAGNLPYQISTALTERLLNLEGRVPRAAFLVQREVAERLVAGPGGRSYGGLSVLVAAAAEARLLGHVGRGSFRPPPKVDGAFVGLLFRKATDVEGGMLEFSKTVRLAFGLRRKTLRNALAAGWGRRRAQLAIEALGQGSSVRAEELSLEQFRTLHQMRPGAGA